MSSHEVEVDDMVAQMTDQAKDDWLCPCYVCAARRQISERIDPETITIKQTLSPGSAQRASDVFYGLGGPLKPKQTYRVGTGAPELLVPGVLTQLRSEMGELLARYAARAAAAALVRSGLFTRSDGVELVLEQARRYDVGHELVLPQNVRQPKRSWWRRLLGL